MNKQKQRETRAKWILGFLIVFVLVSVSFVSIWYNNAQVRRATRENASGVHWFLAKSFPRTISVTDSTIDSASVRDIGK